MGKERFTDCVISFLEGDGWDGAVLPITFEFLFAQTKLGSEGVEIG